MDTLTTGIYVAQMVEGYAENNPDSAIGKLYSSAEDKVQDVLENIGEQIKNPEARDGSGFSNFIAVMKDKFSEISGKVKEKFSDIFESKDGEELEDKIATRDPEHEAPEDEPATETPEIEAETDIEEEAPEDDSGSYDGPG